MKMHYSTRCAQVLALAGLTVACSNDAVTPINSAAANGGSSATSGGSSLGSGTSTFVPGLGGGSTGGANAGGAPTGGTSTTAGGAIGGTATVGGDKSTGGTTATGGAATGIGGKSVGGSTAAGGKSTGGAATTGGAAIGMGGASIGGATASGGASPGTPSSGCSLASVATGKAIDGTITVGGQARTYRLSVPTDYKPGEPLPLIYALNGVGGDGKGAQSAFQLETNHRALFVYPDSSYNDTVSTVAWFFEENGVDVAFFDTLNTFLTQNYCVDTDRIFALGVSSGAIMANMLGCFRGNVLRAIAPASGMTWSNTCKGDVAVMVFCGAQDTFNPCDDAKNGGLSETNFWAPHNSCTTQTAPSPVATICNAFQNCNAKDPVLICKHPGGHMWPTGGGDMMWSFFMGL